jgi:hypothetical protein
MTQDSKKELQRIQHATLSEIDEKEFATLKKEDWPKKTQKGF